MFKVIGQKSEKFGILDTDDNTTEYYTLKDAYNLSKKYNLSISGLDYSIRKSLDYCVTDFLKALQNGYSSNSEVNTLSATASVRSWGNWVKPKFCYDSDADEEDYDWKELDSQSCKRLELIVHELRKKYPQCEINVQTGEKEYIYLNVNIK